MNSHIFEDKKYHAIAATDFDGTLYRSDASVSDESIRTLKMLGDLDILRVIVTGRSFYSLTSAIDTDFPVDYYILSSGSGVYAVKQKKLIYQTALPFPQAQTVGALLLSLNCAFMIHETLPDNHLFAYHRSGKQNNDFEARIHYYEEYGREIHDLSNLDSDISQFVVIENPGSNLYETLKKQLYEYTVIRTTSPLDHASSWIEIFPKGTDKGSTLQWLADEYGVSREHVFSIGNDFNDLHMLRWAQHAFVVANAPDPLLEEFRVVPRNDDEGFSTAISFWLKEAAE